MKNGSIYYSVGGLMYCPANNASIVNSLVNEKFGQQFSLCLCLEDTIRDEYLSEAEDILVDSIGKIYEAKQHASFHLPNIFIRVRTAAQLLDITKRLGQSVELISGFSLPKFDLDNADSFIDALITANSKTSNKLYMMPIFESPSVISLKTRYLVLDSVKQKFDNIEEFILNVRVGGNDFCNLFGFRRHLNESIHSIKPISSVFTDIVTTFGTDYVVSGPVFEYYNGPDWEKYFRREVHDDKLCGFMGKTIIHPNQIAVLNDCYKVTRQDYEDALAIVNWDRTSHSMVQGGSGKTRMNEYKTHHNWAESIVYQANIYGIRD